jgi:predicted RNA-binding protein YlxR (DUF448 family)/ribosomal protein L30E
VLSKNRSHIPIRSCIGCNQKFDKFSLIRFLIKNEERLLTVDPSQQEHGRGYYVCPDETCLNNLWKLRKFKQDVSSIKNSKIEEFKRMIGIMVQLNRIQSLVGLARRAGKVSLGQQAVEAAIKKNQAKFIVLAEDSAQNTKEQFRTLAQSRKIETIEIGGKSEWGRLFSRETVAVLAVLHHGFARAIKGEID